MALPTPHSLKAQDTGMPQMKRRSAVRTAAGNVQEALLARIRAVRDDPLLVLPDVVGDEPKAIASLRETLEGVQRGKLGFFARRDKGLVGAVWACRELAERESLPRLMDARTEGGRRFFLPVGHLEKAACLGVQNFDDPLALLMAYDGMAEDGLHFFADPDLWCTGKRAAFPEAWLAALGARLHTTLEAAGGDARCPHPDRAVVAHTFDGAELRLCGACCGKESGAAITARVRAPGGRRPFGLDVVLPDGTRKEVPRAADALYRVGTRSGADLVAAVLEDWRGGLAGRFALGDRVFADQAAFLDGLDAPAWMRPALAAMTANGHAGPDAGLAHLLALHRDRLTDGIRALGADPAQVVAQSPNADEGALLRVAHEQAERAKRKVDLPRLPPGAGPLATWIDGFVRSRILEGEAAAVAKVKREAGRLENPAHVAAFLAACGLDPAVGTGFEHGSVDAGKHWMPLAKRVLEAGGADYIGALRAYLEESGSGETLA